MCQSGSSLRKTFSHSKIPLAHPFMVLSSSVRRTYWSKLALHFVDSSEFGTAITHLQFDVNLPVLEAEFSVEYFVLIGNPNNGFVLGSRPQLTALFPPVHVAANSSLVFAFFQLFWKHKLGQLTCQTKNKSLFLSCAVRRLQFPRELLSLDQKPIFRYQVPSLQNLYRQVNLIIWKIFTYRANWLNEPIVFRLSRPPHAQAKPMDKRGSALYIPLYDFLYNARWHPELRLWKRQSHRSIFFPSLHHRAKVYHRLLHRNHSVTWCNQTLTAINISNRMFCIIIPSLEPIRVDFSPNMIGPVQHIACIKVKSSAYQGETIGPLTTSSSSCL